MTGRIERANACMVQPNERADYALRESGPVGAGLHRRLFRRHLHRDVVQRQATPLLRLGVGIKRRTVVEAVEHSEHNLEFFQQGCDGLLLNTAIAQAKEPVRMARAMKLAVEAGRDAFLAGRIPMKAYASASSPLTGLVQQ